MIRNPPSPVLISHIRSGAEHQPSPHSAHVSVITGATSEYNVLSWSRFGGSDILQHCASDVMCTTLLAFGFALAMGIRWSCVARTTDVKSHNRSPLPPCNLPLVCTYGLSGDAFACSAHAVHGSCTAGNTGPLFLSFPNPLASIITYSQRPEQSSNSRQRQQQCVDFVWIEGYPLHLVLLGVHRFHGCTVWVRAANVHAVRMQSRVIPDVHQTHQV